MHAKLDSMKLMNPFTLSFNDKALEQAFLSATFERTRYQGRTAMLVGMSVYLLCGMLDHWFASTEVVAEVWQIRLTALCVPAFVMAITFTPWFSEMSHLLLASVGFAAGTGIICMQMILPIESSPYYYPMMIVVTFYTYNFVGTRFIYAVGVDLILLIAYNLLFSTLLQYPLHILASHDFFIISANLIGGSAGYLAEHGRRILYLHQRELDEQSQQHLVRSLHDGLTGLPNRDLLYDHITQAMSEAHRNASTHCGIFLDLDGFKAINDSLTHQVGDSVLREVGQRLISAVRSIDTVARIGGDEFFVLALHIDNQEAACGLASKLLEHLAQPIPHMASNLSLGVSIGVCLFPYDGMSVSDIIHRADKAMYHVKSNGKGDYKLAD